MLFEILHGDVSIVLYCATSGACDNSNSKSYARYAQHHKASFTIRMNELSNVLLHSRHEAINRSREASYKGCKRSHSMKQRHLGLRKTTGNSRRVPKWRVRAFCKLLRHRNDVRQESVAYRYGKSLEMQVQCLEQIQSSLYIVQTSVRIEQILPCFGPNWHSHSIIQRMTSLGNEPMAVK